jgi:hypothetical protein
MLYQLSYWLSVNPPMSWLGENIKDKKACPCACACACGGPWGKPVEENRVLSSHALARGFSTKPNCDIDTVHMIWVILFIPLALWLSVAYASHFTPVSLAIVFGVILVFGIVELSQISKDRSRSKAPLFVMCLILVSLLVSVLFR